MNKLSLYIPAENKNKLNAISASYGLSTNKLLNILIAQFIENEKQKLKLELTKAGVEL